LELRDDVARKEPPAAAAAAVRGFFAGAGLPGQ